ncbi:NADH-quinone oxidoreductase subunit N [Dysgonomonas sp. PH5-45]|uniref:NADH-quinone oxidoreductase subunit N n=1 Tax=unclassified Dysgonomonas TaxID=2630389 RepID=UPI002474FA19|nr:MULTISPECIES: NADH-quinone oxidoreductase subunit N [unclassified Dysgonomonas]MDH6355741.1 NADH-quinone oxidoreductase subunit N [Dysgonomonas sp. PH5-45]MDH6388638.1 NADH-quinone oxidoreductase subunit N [Dysgonomonas sp. PH5-37]
MDLSNYLLMKPELSLTAVFLLLIIYDLFASDKTKKYYFPVACLLFLVHTVYCFFLLKEEGTSFGGMYIAGQAQAAIKCILNVGVFMIFLQANNWLSKPDAIVKRGEFFMLTVLTLLGMYFMISSGNFLIFYIGLETASLPIAALVAFNKYTHESAEAGAKYIFNAVFSSAIMVFGLSFVYGACGSLYFDNLAISMFSSPLIIMGMILFLAGLFFKISLVPFHLWAPDVYEGAPTNVTLYLSTISKGAAVFALMVILYKVFPLLSGVWTDVISIIIILTITVGNLFALRQNNMKRFLAFSSISQAGYIMLSVFNGTQFGMGATLFYIFVYVFSNAAAFGVITAIENQTGKVNMSDYNGMYATNPKLTWAMTLAMFSLGGIPPTAGFFSKLFVFSAAMEQGHTILVFIAFLNTVISLYYYLLVVKAMFINKNSSPIECVSTDGYLKISLTLSMAGILLIGMVSCVFEYLRAVSFGIW